MSSPTPSPLRVDGIAPVITLAARRPSRRPVFTHGLRSLGAAFLFGAAITGSVAGVGILAALAVRHALVALPVLAVLATLAVWPLMARRLRDIEAEVRPESPRKRSSKGQILQHPAARKLNRV